jgi:hypothetical protein
MFWAVHTLDSRPPRTKVLCVCRWGRWLSYFKDRHLGKACLGTPSMLGWIVTLGYSTWPSYVKYSLSALCLSEMNEPASAPTTLFIPPLPRVLITLWVQIKPLSTWQRTSQRTCEPSIHAHTKGSANTLASWDAHAMHRWKNADRTSLCNHRGGDSTWGGKLPAPWKEPTALLLIGKEPRKEEREVPGWPWTTGSVSGGSSWTLTANMNTKARSPAATSHVTPSPSPTSS